MASTRNKNTAGDYSLATRENLQFSENILYNNSAWGVSNKTYLPGDGVFASRIPYTELSENGVDIESFLRGTRATDLTGQYVAPLPQLRQLKSLCMYRKPNTIMPVPLVSEKNQRPRILGL